MIRVGKKRQYFTTDVGIYDFFTFYHKKHTTKVNGRVVRDKYFLSKKIYGKVLNDFNEAIRDLIINESFEYKLPYRMGILTIRKHKNTPWINDEGELMNNLPVDWDSTLKLWEEDPEAKEDKKLVRHYNEHTNGYVARWYYGTGKAKYINKSAYSFIPCRTAKLKLKDALKDEDNDVDYFLK